MDAWCRLRAAGPEAGGQRVPRPRFPRAGRWGPDRPPTPDLSGPNPSPGPADHPLRASAAAVRSPHLWLRGRCCAGHGQGRGTRASSSRIIVWGAQCSCRKPFILGAGKGLTQGRLPAPDPHPEAPGRTGLGAACGGRHWGLRGARWAGGPVAVSRAPPSSLPGSIRDQTPSNAAQ